MDGSCQGPRSRPTCHPHLPVPIALSSAQQLGGASGPIAVKMAAPRSHACRRTAVPCVTIIRKMLAVAIVLLLMCSCCPTASACGPGRGGNRRRNPRKLTPLVFKEFVPNVSENTLGASGLLEGKVGREDPRFRELVPNYNQDIIFKDEEGTGADRLMTLRLKEKINTLAISVMNQWPGVRLRVTEGWDEQGHHAPDSLHYEGRAVDITTSDKDRSKNGMLARLAVEAGFDWVFFESRAHIHASVKSEKSDASRSGGCFHGDARVRTRSGPMAMHELRVGDEILALGPDGQLVFSPVLLFLDRDPGEETLFVQLQLESGRRLRLTPYHLLFLVDTSEVFSAASSTQHAAFAKQAAVGQYLVTTASDGPSTNVSQTRLDKIVRVETKVLKGVFAPLTSEGNLFVNEILASSYAALADQVLAHRAFAPLRLWSNFKEALVHLHKKTRRKETPPPRLADNDIPHGVHWYPETLYRIGKKVLPRDLLD